LLAVSFLIAVPFSIVASDKRIIFTFTTTTEEETATHVESSGQRVSRRTTSSTGIGNIDLLSLEMESLSILK
jgi:hypothetical protein